jgi:hypothetical protein
MTDLADVDVALARELERTGTDPADITVQGVADAAQPGYAPAIAAKALRRAGSVDPMRAN